MCYGQETRRIALLAAVDRHFTCPLSARLHTHSHARTHEADSIASPRSTRRQRTHHDKGAGQGKVILSLFPLQGVTDQGFTRWRVSAFLQQRESKDRSVLQVNPCAFLFVITGFSLFLVKKLQHIQRMHVGYNPAYIVVLVCYSKSRQKLPTTKESSHDVIHYSRLVQIAIETAQRKFSRKVL